MLGPFINQTTNLQKFKFTRVRFCSWCINLRFKKIMLDNCFQSFANVCRTPTKMCAVTTPLHPLYQGCTTFSVLQTAICLLVGITAASVFKLFFALLLFCFHTLSLSCFHTSVWPSFYKVCPYSRQKFFY